MRGHVGEVNAFISSSILETPDTAGLYDFSAESSEL